MRRRLCLYSAVFASIPPCLPLFRLPDCPFFLSQAICRPHFGQPCHAFGGATSSRMSLVSLSARTPLPCACPHGPPPPPQAILMDLGRMHRDQERLAADVRLLVGQVRAAPLGYACWWATSMFSPGAAGEVSSWWARSGNLLLGQVAPPTPTHTCGQQSEHRPCAPPRTPRPPPRAARRVWPPVIAACDRGL